MTIIFSLLWGAAMLLLARGICGRWVNHLNVYTLIWTASIVAYELRLIRYNAVVFEAWVYVYVAWAAIYLGTAIGRMIWSSPAHHTFPELNMSRLRNAIVVLSSAGLASSIVLTRNIVHALGSGGILSALTEYGNQIYALRFNGEVSGIEYFNFLPYAGCVLAGVYTARRGRVTIASLLPLSVMVIDGVVSMQRSGMVFGILLTSFAYFLTPKVSRLEVARWQKLGIVIAMLGVFLAVTAGRGAAEVYEGETPTLATIGDVIPVAPSLYLYATSPIPCFSEYLKNPSQDGKELWGRYMFASIYRFLSKLGFDTYVPYYPNFYYTPVPVNAGTYLREVQMDFGGTAVFIYPFALGLVISFLAARSRGPLTVVLLTFLYLVIALSVDVDFVSGGGWYFPLPIALAVTVWVTSQRSAKPLGSEPSSVPT